MRQAVSSFLLICVLLFGSFLFAQDNPTEIKVNISTATFEKISERNYDLHIQWEPYIGADKYSIRYTDATEEIKNPEEDLKKQQTTPNDTTGITLSTNSNTCYFQVVAVDEAMNPVAESKVYRATMSFTEAPPLIGVDVVFIRALWGSFSQMDPIAGWLIVAVIVGLLIYGVFMSRSIRRSVKKQNHHTNQILDQKIKDFLTEWRENRTNQEQLVRLLEKVNEFNKGQFSLLTMISNAIEETIESLQSGNTSKDGLEYELENCIDYELENLKIGSHSKHARFISLARIKMLGETAPMLGLLGTVSGLIVAFFNILESSRGGADYLTLLSELSSGIYSAIVTTIIGLLIGIALLFIHHGVEVKIKRLQHAWHKKYLEIREILH